MILQGNQRGGGSDLANHLMKAENEHIEIHSMRGFVSDTLMGAFNEAYAVSRGTQCSKYLYSLSVNPPPDQQVSTPDIIAAIEKVESELGLEDQPRAIVFHEKEGRRHAHAVWSRINTDEMKAVHISFDRQKLQSISRDLFLEHGWKMPAGLANKEHKDPRNFSLSEWQQSKRTGQDPRSIKSAIQDAWAISDGKESFQNALEERGFTLARGDKRGHVAKDMYGEVYSIARMVGVKAKDVRAKLGDENDLQSVEQVRTKISEDMSSTFTRMKGDLSEQYSHTHSVFETARHTLVQRQTSERGQLTTKIEQRHIAETHARQSRFRTGFRGLWDRFNGTHRATQKQNKIEAQECASRDQSEKDALTFKHLQQRQQLQFLKGQVRRQHTRQHKQVERELQAYRKLKSGLPVKRKKLRPPIPYTQEDSSKQIMHPDDHKRLQREHDIAKATRGPDYSQLKQEIYRNKVRAAEQARAESNQGIPRPAELAKPIGNPEAEAREAYGRKIKEAELKRPPPKPYY